MISFTILAALALAGAVGAILCRNLIHCALSLIASFAGVAGVFLHLNAEFLGLVQILVYVGAVGILLVFAVLLTRGGDDTATRFSKSWPWGAGIAIVLAVLLTGAWLKSPAVSGVAGSTASPRVAEIGKTMMAQFIVPLEILGILLTAALIGAMLIALPASTNRLEIKGREEMEQQSSKSKSGN